MEDGWGKSECKTMDECMYSLFNRQTKWAKDSHTTSRLAYARRSKTINAVIRLRFLNATNAEAAKTNICNSLLQSRRWLRKDTVIAAVHLLIQFRCDGCATIKKLTKWINIFAEQTWTNFHSEFYNLQRETEMDERKIIFKILYKNMESSEEFTTLGKRNSKRQVERTFIISNEKKRVALYWHFLTQFPFDVH